MGNYSYLIEQVGCVIDAEKVKVMCKLKGNKCTEYGLPKETLTNENLGGFIDGWKIQGYWYDDFIEFLYVCVDCMKGLTEHKSDNMLEMEEEQGFKFYIYFFLHKGEKVVEVEAMPMEWQTIALERR